MVFIFATSQKSGDNFRSKWFSSSPILNKWWQLQENQRRSPCQVISHGFTLKERWETPETSKRELLLPLIFESRKVGACRATTSVATSPCLARYILIVAVGRWAPGLHNPDQSLSDPSPIIVYPCHY